MPHTLRVTFHGLGPAPRALSDGEAGVWLRTESFEAALDAIAGVPEHLITFDDGNLSDLTVALPRLVARGLTGTFFICSGRIGEAHFLDQAQLRELADAGMRIGSHGIAHIPWRSVRGVALEAELAGSRGRLEDTVGAAVTDAACPFGSYDRAVLTAARRAGYRRVFTSDGVGPAIGGWVHPRTTITETTANSRAIAAMARPSIVSKLHCAVRTLVKSRR